MNPNSSHQWWSRWTFQVRLAPGSRRSGESAIDNVRENCARFGRKAFGSSSEMRVDRQCIQGVVTYRIDIRTEGHPVTDAVYVAHMEANWRRFFVNGFGPRAEVTLEARLEAGSRQDGSPSDQLIIVPPIAVTVH